MNSKSPPQNPRKQLVRAELLSKAAEVFERRGFAQTRLQDIADALSLSRSALYYYFESKDQILAALVEEHTGARSDRLRALADERTRSAIDRLGEVLRGTIMERLSAGSRLRALDQLASEMPDDLRKAFDHGRRRVLDVYTEIIAQGIAASEFRDIDPRTAAFAILGIASWTSWWYSPGGRKSPDELADILVDIALNGLVLHGSERADTHKRTTLLSDIRTKLDELERL